jgi:hypothetical protein
MLKKVAFVLALTVCVSLALALESGPSNTVGFVKITCTQNFQNAFGEPFTTWDVISGVPQYGVFSGKPSDVIGAQLTGGSAFTGDRCIEQTGAGQYAYRTTTAALWAGSLENAGGMLPGIAFWLHNKQAFDQDMVLAGEVDTSGFGPIAINPNFQNAITWRDARNVDRSRLNLLTSGFTGGSAFTSDRLIEQTGAGRYCYYNTATPAWAGSLPGSEPGVAYWIHEKNGNSWNYNYVSGGAMPPAPDRPGGNEGTIDRINRPTSPTRSVR